jgi:RNA polymerase sigma-70 factor (ECF subfamily)
MSKSWIVAENSCMGGIMKHGPDPETRSGAARRERLDPESWVDDHGDALFRYALRRVSAADLAADLVQETFLAGLRSLERFEGRSAGRSWLIAILRRKNSDHYRSLEHPAARSRPLSEMPEEVFDGAGRWIRPPKPWNDPEQRLEAAEFLTALDGCLDGLPTHLADPFILREREEQEPATI